MYLRAGTHIPRSKEIQLLLLTFVRSLLIFCLIATHNDALQEKLI